MKEIDIQKIEEYLLDTMSSKEKKEFEQRLKKELELKKELDIMNSVMISAELSGKEKMKIDFEAIHKQHFDKPKEIIKSTNNNNRVLKALGILLLLGIMLTALWFLTNQKSTVGGEQLYVTYFEPTPLELRFRGTELNEDLKSLEDLFNANKYQIFIDHYEKSNSLDNENVDLILAHGQAQLELGQYMNAESTFKALLTNPLYSDLANWYLALLHIKQNKYEDATKYLSSINPANKYGKKAKELMGQLK